MHLTFNGQILHTIITFVCARLALLFQITQRLYAVMLLMLAHAAAAQSNAFEVIPLGIRGGSDEANLSSYAVSAAGQSAYVCFDAGTIRAGIEASISNGVWKGDAADVLRNHIKGYVISHPHLDHVSGLILNSPDDSAKPVYGTTECLGVIRDKYFSWQSWAKFANEGEKPTLNKYTYKYLTPGETVALEGTGLTMTPYLLSHVNPYTSTAFVIHHRENALLYFGDTGADRLEKSDKLATIWNAVAPMIKEKKLKAIFIEVSFANDQPDKLLFGHLTPKLLMEELSRLAELLPAGSLSNFPVVITHMKPASDRIEKITRELHAANNLGVKLIFPEQGRRLEF